MWNFPRPGVKSVSPAIVGGFLTMRPPGKPLFLFFLVFIYLAVPGLSCGCSDHHCGMRSFYAGSQLWRVESSSLTRGTRDRTWTPCIGSLSLSHWTARKVPLKPLFKSSVSKKKSSLSFFFLKFYFCCLYCH